jgi:hypothetical protein
LAKRYYLASLARIADFDNTDFDVEPRPRDAWATGDYTVGEICWTPRNATNIESIDGRNVEVVEGDLVIGALGVRAATLGAVGDWREIGPDGEMEALTSAGLLGRSTSVGWNTPPLTRLTYRGHVIREGKKLGMKDFVPSVHIRPYQCPTIVIIGTSMEAGKTGAAKVIIRQLEDMGLRVVGAKLSGAGRNRDILAMADAGAAAVYDFVDVGLPSSVCPEEEYREDLRKLLTMISSEKPDVVVAEAGASPLEPYNGATVMAEIGDNRRCTVLCASDPYAVVGVVKSFDITPDIVSGIATNTTAGIELIRKLTGLEALNIIDRRCHAWLRKILAEKLSLEK